MTMLDRMRRHRGTLKWVLALVVLAFIFFYVPDFLTEATGVGPNEVVARVGNETVTASTFRRRWQSQMQMYQSAYGGQLNAQLLRQMGIEQQILRQLLDEQAAVAEARRLGLRVSDAEVAQRIYAIPAFQQNGRFAGPEIYQQVLRSQRPPLTTSEFEENLRKSLLVDKLRAALTDWITVSDADVEQEFRRRNEKVKLDLVLFSADRLRGQVTLTDADVAQYFAAHQEDYRVGEQRKMKYLLVDVDAIKAKTTVSDAEVEQYYRDNQQLYSSPEQVRASHILLKTDGKDEAAVRAEAEKLLARARAGADFAALAKEHSEDEASAAQGGDLDYFGRGRMVKEFEDAAFGLEPGAMSDLVKTQYGFHIIKVADRKAATTQPLQDVRAQIADQLAYQKAQSQAAELAQALEKEITRPADLERVATARGLTVQETNFFSKDEPIAGLGPSPDLAEELFGMTDGTVAGPLRVARGHVFFTPTGRQDSRLPALDEVRDRAREDAIEAKARELATTRAEALAADFAKNFAAAAKSAGLEVKTTDLVARGAALPDVGISPAVEAAAFALPQGGVTAPVRTDAGTVIARVVERQDVTPGELAAAKDGLRAEITAEKKNLFFSSYMVKAREGMTIEINQQRVQAILGPATTN